MIKIKIYKLLIENIVFFISCFSKKLQSKIVYCKSKNIIRNLLTFFEKKKFIKWYDVDYDGWQNYHRNVTLCVRYVHWMFKCFFFNLKMVKKEKIFGGEKSNGISWNLLNSKILEIFKVSISGFFSKYSIK